MNKETIQPTKKYGDISIIPELSITEYDHYSPKLLSKFYNKICQVGFSNQGYIFPNGKFAGLHDSHAHAQQQVEHLCSCGCDCMLYHGCVRVGYMDGRFDNQIYIESLFVPTGKAHEAVLDFISSQKNIDSIIMDIQASKLYEKRLKYIISKTLPSCTIS